MRSHTTRVGLGLAVEIGFDRCRRGFKSKRATKHKRFTQMFALSLGGANASTSGN